LLAPRQPRPHPKPREGVLDFGEWELEIDQGDSGLERGLHDSTPNQHFATTIRVPFAPESELSGVCNTNFLEALWYRRTITFPKQWTGRRVPLHFQAVDHDSTVWVNGVEVARHRGGFTPFTADLRGVAKPGEEVTIVVRARDSRQGAQARGKNKLLVPMTDAILGDTQLAATRLRGWRAQLELVARLHWAIYRPPRLADRSDPHDAPGYAAERHAPYGVGASHRPAIRHAMLLQRGLWGWAWNRC
jgi:Glycosyl hydrolases family 2, sugar binding domain